MSTETQTQVTVVLKYTILSGDTFSSIADGIDQSAGVTYQQIESANPSIDPNNLQIGQVLDIPSKSTGETVLKYTVIAGDSISGIASSLALAAGVTTNDIEAANPSVDPGNLQIGQLINIPSTSSQPSEPVVQAPNMGYWYWTWSSGQPFPEATLSMAFSGYADPTQALQNSASILNKLVGTKFISLGGGNEAGSFDADTLQSITAAINNGDFSDYDGIAYDVEEGSSGLEQAFADSFAAAQAKNLKVLVTVSHSAPYGISDAASLMQSFFTNKDIDFMSPQLYTTGSESSNDYDTSGGVEWSEYATSIAVVIPSIVDNSYYPDAQTYFEGQGVTLEGYVQWEQID